MDADETLLGERPNELRKALINKGAMRPRSSWKVIVRGLPEIGTTVSESSRPPAIDMPGANRVDARPDKGDRSAEMALLLSITTGFGAHPLAHQSGLRISKTDLTKLGFFAKTSIWLIAGMALDLAIMGLILEQKAVVVRVSASANPMSFMLLL